MQEILRIDNHLTRPTQSVRKVLDNQTLFVIINSNNSKCYITFLSISVGVPVIVSYNGGIPPFRRGFFCDDNSIKYPYVEDTISDAVLMGVGFTMAFILVSEPTQHVKPLEDIDVEVFKRF